MSGKHSERSSCEPDRGQHHRRGYNEKVYFINPMIMFDGDWVSFVRSYVKKKKVKQGDPQQLSVFDAIPPFRIG